MTDNRQQAAHEESAEPALPELLRELHRVKLQLHAARHRERKKYIAEVQWTINEFGIQPHELSFPPEYGPRRRPGNKPKYYDPETGRTWSGIGAIPDWLRGKNLALYEIERQLRESNSDPDAGADSVRI